MRDRRRGHRSRPSWRPAEGVRRIQARLDRPGLIEELVDRCEVIISLTALCNPSLYNTQPLAVIDASYTDLVPVVKLCTARRRWLIHFSTCEVYGRRALDNLGAPMPAMREDESALWLGPVHLERWSYACAKQLLERVIFASGRHHGLPFTIVRPFNVIGPRMDFVPGVDGEGVPRVLAAFMSALLAGEELLLVDGGQRRRSFVYVDDFVAAIGRMLDRPQAAQGEIFNLGHPGNELSIAELAQQLGAAYQAQVPGAVPRFRNGHRRGGVRPRLRRLRSAAARHRQGGHPAGLAAHHHPGRDAAPDRPRLPGALQRPGGGQGGPGASPGAGPPAGRRRRLITPLLPTCSVQCPPPSSSPLTTPPATCRRWSSGCWPTRPATCRR